MTGLTILQQRVLGFIQHCVRREGKAPSYRAIARELGVDVRSAYQHVQALERKEILERVDGRIELLPDYQPPVGVPVLGRVAAGTPILAVENLEDHVDLGGQFQEEDVFLLRVRGDSMTGAGINDGDLVLARKQDTVEDGEIGVVVIGEEATGPRQLLSGLATIILRVSILFPAPPPPGGEGHIVHKKASFLCALGLQCSDVVDDSLAGFSARFPGRLSAVAGQVQFQDYGVVDQAVDGCRGGHGVLEDGLPLRKRQVAG